MHYLLFYDVVDDYVRRRVPLRSDHLKKVQLSYERGELILGGALADPVDGAVLVFRDHATAEEFAKSDPYVLNGLVRSWRVRPWTTVIGDGIVPSSASYMPGLPDASEYAPYAKVYLDQIAGHDVFVALVEQLKQTLALLRPVDDRRASEFVYAPGKWTIKQVIGHVADTERVFAYRAMRIARGDATPLPGFDQELYVNSANFNDLSLTAILEDFQTLREGTIALLRNLPAEAWNRRGVTNQYSVTVRGIAFHIAGHEQHHVNILRRRYLN